MLERKVRERLQLGGGLGPIQRLAEQRLGFAILVSATVDLAEPNNSREATARVAGAREAQALGQPGNRIVRSAQQAARVTQAPEEVLLLEVAAGSERPRALRARQSTAAETTAGSRGTTRSRASWMLIASR